MIPEEISKSYQVLEIEPSASLHAIKEAYRGLVKVWHPDRFQNDQKLQHKAQEKLKDINAAYTAILEYIESADIRTKPEASDSRKDAGTDDRVEAYTVGEAFYFGQGRQKDLNEAAKFFLKSAELGYAQAQTFLGLMYYRGEGVRKDNSAAADWWTRAAEQGHPFAQDSLGCLYKEGFNSNFLEKAAGNATSWKYGDSKIEAYKWFNLAVTNGKANARGGMEEISFYMSQHQINEARTQASRLYPAYPNISTSQAIIEWFGCYLAEIKGNEKFTGWHEQVMSDLQAHPGIEADVAMHTSILLENEFSGKKSEQAQEFLRFGATNWKRLFGHKPNKNESARLISFRMKTDAWDAFSPKYICKKENILNYLWLKIYAGK